MEKMASVNMERLLDLSPHAFEVLTGQIFETLGYEVEQSKAGRDGGVDLRLKKDEETAIAQCKRYRGQVGEPIVRDFFGTMTHEKVSRGFVVTTGMFSLPAQTWAVGKPIVLVDGLELVKVLQWQAEEIMGIAADIHATPQTTKSGTDEDEASYQAMMAVYKRHPYLTWLALKATTWLQGQMADEKKSS